MKNCLNCNAEITEADRYCRSCGQNTSEPKLSIRDLVSNFFANVLNLDSKFFFSLRSLFIPGKFTIDYVAGRRIKYYTPGRTLFVSMVIFFFLLAMAINNLAHPEKLDRLNELAWADKQNRTFDSLVQELRLQTQDSLLFLDSLESKLFTNMNVPDSMSINTSMTDSSGSTFKLTDVLNRPMSEYADPKEANDKFLQYIVNQLRKSMLDISGSINKVISNLIWMFILMAITMAVLMKILYLRRRHYYAEHLIFQMHYLSYAIITGSIYLIIIILRNQFEPIIFGVFSLMAGIYLYIALKRYYRQGFIKTTIKFIFLIIGYSLSFITFMLLVSFISFLLF